MVRIFEKIVEKSPEESKDREYLNELIQELNEIFHNIELKNSEVKELAELIKSKEMAFENIDRSLAEAIKIAQKTEQRALSREKEIVSQAEAKVAARKLQIATVENEMLALEKELAFYTNLVKKEKTPDKSSKSDQPYRLIEEPVVRQEKEQTWIEDNSSYSMELVAFVNARHFVKFGKKAGPVHAHSWQAEIEIRVPPEDAETTEFAKVSKVVTTALAPYENVILNQVYPFNLIHPTTENMAMFFYNLLEDALRKINLGLARLMLWENPTKGIEVAKRNIQFDTLSPVDEVSDIFDDMPVAYDQSAATSDAGFVGKLGKRSNSAKTKAAPLESLAETIRPPYLLKHYLLALAIICGLAFLTYFDILFASAEQIYPWGSDTWGHLFKAENLYQQIIQGNYYPQFTEYWYNGSQPFRYWAPLPYYVIAGLMFFTNNIFVAGNYYIFLCALLGALSWLLFSRRMGLWPAVMAGLIWLIWQDNVRVAFSEGNLPRVLATALLPLLFFLFLHILQNRKSYKGIIVTVFVLHLVILCHAMIGAVYCICLALFAFFLWVFHGCNLKDLLKGVAVLAVGIATSSWWLLPSLTGGITAINVQAVKEIVQFVSADISFNPVYRLNNIETFYWGISLLVAIFINLFFWKSKPAWAKSSAVIGIFLILITFPLIRVFYLTLPLSHLLWPLRFSSFAAMAILFACLSFKLPEHRQKWLKSSKLTGIVLIVLFLVLGVDCYASFRLLAHTRTKPFGIIQSADFIAQKPGWRVATIDLSQLGSAPSYILSQTIGREQTFGWAWQGAMTSRNIMLLNTGLENQFHPFLFRSCVVLGATDLVVKENLITDMEAFNKAAALAGYKMQEKFGEISIWRSVNTPYLVEKKPAGLVIGRYSGTVGILFPSLEIGVSPYIDDYSSEKLQEYPLLILSGATWKSKNEAEELIKGYLAGGGEVFVELAGMPENVLAKQPEFLGVFGEPVSLKRTIEIWGDDKRILLPPVIQGFKEWQAYVPMGLDGVTLEFSYYGNQAPVLGYKMVDNHKVWFLGNNLTYHAFRTGSNSASMKLVERIFGLDTDYSGNRLIPLQDYEASENGYRMTYDIDRDIEVVLPVAALDGMKVKLNGEEIAAVDNFENLLQLKLPSGKHEIEITLEKTFVHILGLGISLLTFFLLVAGLIYINRTGDAES